MTDARLQIEGPASIDGQPVDAATVPAWAVSEIVSDGPLSVEIDHEAGTQPIRDRQALAEHLVGMAEQGATPAQIVDHLAISIGAINAVRWSDLRGVNRETAEGNAAAVTRQLAED